MLKWAVMAPKVIVLMFKRRNSRVKIIQCSLILGAVFVLNGCVVQSTYSKTIAVTKDADGRVIQTVESETVVQPASGYPLRLEKIKGVQP
jgi:hypothetical protein